MAISLSRNTKMYISTVKGLVEGAAAFSNLNTFEVPVLDGYSFSQDVETQNIILSAAACSPVRGQKIFNTALNPVSVEFPTYMKPFRLDGSTTGAVERILWEAFVGNGSPASGGTNAVEGATMNVTFARSNVHELLKINIIFVMDNAVYMIEDVGINAVDIDFAIDAIAQLGWAGEGAKITSLPEALDWVAGTNYLAEGTGTEAPQFIKNKLSQIQVYTDTNVAVYGNQIASYGGNLVGTDLAGLSAATYSFNIAVEGGTEEQVDVVVAGGETITALVALIETQLDGTTDTNKATITIPTTLGIDGNLQITSDDTGTAGADSTSIAFNETGITAGLELFTALGAATSAASFLGIATAEAGLLVGKEYLIPITGGSMTLTNNVTYLTPEELGKVNQPIPGGFTGTREFGGTLNAYLNTGANRTGGLLDDLTTDAALTESTNRFWISVNVGGCNSSPKVEFTMPRAHLVIPTTSVEDVISTEIGFTAIGSDLGLADEISIKYTADLT